MNARQWLYRLIARWGPADLVEKLLERPLVPPAPPSGLGGQSSDVGSTAQPNVKGTLILVRHALRRVARCLRRLPSAVATDLGLIEQLKAPLDTAFKKLASVNEAAVGDVDELRALARELLARTAMIHSMARRPLPVAALVAMILSITALYGWMEIHPERPDRPSATEASHLAIAQAAIVRARQLSGRPATTPAEHVARYALTDAALRTAVQALRPVLLQLQRADPVVAGSLYVDAATVVALPDFLENAAMVTKGSTDSVRPETEKLQAAVLALVDTAALRRAAPLDATTTQVHQHLTWHLLAGVLVLAFLMASSAVLVGFVSGPDSSLSSMLKDIFDMTLKKSALGAAVLGAIAISSPAVAALLTARLQHPPPAPAAADSTTMTPPAGTARPELPADTATRDRSSTITVVDAPVTNRLLALATRVDARSRADSAALAAVRADLAHIRRVSDAVEGRIGRTPAPPAPEATTHPRE